MSEDPKNPEEPIPSGPEQKDYAKVRRPYSKIATELEPGDLAQAGVQKLILAEIARLETEVVKLSDYADDFFEKDKECAVLRCRLKKNTMLEILYTIAISVGSGLIGWLPSSATTGGICAVLAMALGLLGFALLAKWIGEKHEG